MLLLAGSGSSSAQGDGNWSTNAIFYRGMTGQRLTVYCSPTAFIPPIWGTDIYTDDSSICSAGVHAGVIKASEGGQVTIEIRPGAKQYFGTLRNDLESFGFGEWEGSFMVVLPRRKDDSPNGGSDVIRRRANWNSTIAEFRGRTGTRILVTCPAGDRVTGPLWGTEVYSDDSIVCLAGVHAGVITRNGGKVLVEIRPGLSVYSGSTMNGVTSMSYGPWDGSFAVIRKVEGNTDAMPERVIDWMTQGDRLGLAVGQRMKVVCPAGQPLPKRTWGTDAYSADSSVCTAAVHAGLITKSGGSVVVELREGLESYMGTTRNGVPSQGYGAWPQTLVFIR